MLLGFVKSTAQLHSLFALGGYFLLRALLHAFGARVQKYNKDTVSA